MSETHMAIVVAPAPDLLRRLTRLHVLATAWMTVEVPWRWLPRLEGEDCSTLCPATQIESSGLLVTSVPYTSGPFHDPLHLSHNVARGDT
jgi:hypothetical protein